MLNENRFLDTFRGHNIRPIRGIIKMLLDIHKLSEALIISRDAYPTKTEFNTCSFIIYLYLRTLPLKKPFVFSRIWHKQHKLV